MWYSYSLLQHLMITHLPSSCMYHKISIPMNHGNKTNQKLQNDMKLIRRLYASKFYNTQFKIFVQRNYFDKRYHHHTIPSLDISQYSDSGSYIVTELESEPLRRGISKFHEEKSSRKRGHGMTTSVAPSCSTPSSSSNLSSKITSNGFFGSQSPSKSFDGFLMNEVQIRFFFKCLNTVWISSKKNNYSESGISDL